MDNSITKALIMVAGILLAMIVIAFVTFSFRRIGTWAATSDEQILTEQKDKFNKEYEAYDKDLMYGVDVISCLNKALSNNEKINNENFVTGDKYDESYEVKVKVTLKTNDPLEESMRVYYMNERDKKEYAYPNEKGEKGPKNVKIDDVKFDFIQKNTDYFQNISQFKAEDNLKTVEGQTCKSIDKITEFNLTKDNNAPGEEELRALLSVTKAISETINNPDKTNSAKKDNWTKVEFKSALYDLKTRKFKCTSLTYSSSGRVNYIEFKEI